MHKTVLTCINIYCSNMFTDYCNLKGGEGLWDNALKTNTLGLTSLGVEFVELWPLVVKPYVYAPGLKVRQPKLDQNGEEVRLANGRPAYEKTVHGVNEKWTQCIDFFFIPLYSGTVLVERHQFSVVVKNNEWSLNI